MPAVVADTHAVVWYLLDQQTLSHDANAATNKQSKVEMLYLSTISLIEVTYLVEKGRRNGAPFGSAPNYKRSQNTGFANRNYLVTSVPQS